MERRRELPCAPTVWSNGNLNLEEGFSPPSIQMWYYSCEVICYAQEKQWPCVRKSSAAVAADFSSDLELPSIYWLYWTKESKLLSTAESCALLASPFGRVIFQPLLARSQSEPFLVGITTNRKITVLTAFNYHDWNIIVVSLGPDMGLEFLKVTFAKHNETCFTWDSLKPINYACYKNLLLYSEDMIQTPVVVIGDPQDLDHILNQLYGQLSK